MGNTENEKQKKNKYTECLHCEHFFECELKKQKRTTGCLHFSEAKEGKDTRN